MAQDILVAIQTNAEMADANRLTMKLGDFFYEIWRRNGKII